MDKTNKETSEKRPPAADDKGSVPSDRNNEVSDAEWKEWQRIERNWDSITPPTWVSIVCGLLMTTIWPAMYWLLAREPDDPPNHKIKAPNRIKSDKRSVKERRAEHKNTKEQRVQQKTSKEQRTEKKVAKETRIKEKITKK